jgi:hypothetical protein
MFKRQRRPRIEIHGPDFELAGRMLRDARLERRAARSMPRPAPWDWVKPRLVPLLAGPYIDAPDLPIVRGVSDLGPSLVFGVDIGRVYPLVDVEVGERGGRRADLGRA